MTPYTVTLPWSTPGSSSFRREDAIKLLEKFVKNENLRRHMYACEAAMRDYAKLYNGDPDEWGIVGLLHDFDWEIHPTAADHPAAGQPILESRGVSPAIRKAIMAHATHTGVKPETMMEKCMFAVDELTGFIVACALVNPEKKLANVTIDGIKKKLKQQAFAAKVNRQEIAEGVLMLGLPETDHFQHVLSSMQRIHDTLGL
jgi:predicted hydrolase (HD superfamily)